MAKTKIPDSFDDSSVKEVENDPEAEVIIIENLDEPKQIKESKLNPNKS